MGQHKEIKACLLLVIISMSTIVGTFAAPNANARKFAVKSNNPKKVHHKSVVPTKEISERAERERDQSPTSKQDIPQASPEMSAQQGSPAQLIRVIGAPLLQLLRMFFAGPQGTGESGNDLTPGSDKMDSPISGQGFSWGQVIGYGLKLLLAAMGGGSGNGIHDGIDKMGEAENNHPVQVMLERVIENLTGNEKDSNAFLLAQTKELINLAMSLISAMQTSFNQRSMKARSLGEKDRMTDVALASLFMSKGFVKSFNTTNDACREQYLCESARDCAQGIGSSSNFGFCHLTSFATANLMYYTHSSAGDMTKPYMEATRRGRSLENCRAHYHCNEVIS